MEAAVLPVLLRTTSKQRERHGRRPTPAPRPRPRPTPAAAPPRAQVLSLCAAPFLLDRPDVGSIFAADAIARARTMLAAFKGGVGAYSDSRGNLYVREEVARFIEARDGVPANAEVRAPWCTAALGGRGTCCGAQATTAPALPRPHLAQQAPTPSPPPAPCPRSTSL